MEMFSGHGDGTVRCWASRTEEDVEAEEEEIEERERRRGGEWDGSGEGGGDGEMQERKRKRDVLEEVYRGLMEPGVRFT